MSNKYKLAWWKKALLKTFNLKRNIPERKVLPHNRKMYSIYESFSLKDRIRLLFSWKIEVMVIIDLDESSGEQEFHHTTMVLPPYFIR